MQLPKKQFVVVILGAPFWYAFFVLRGWPTKNGLGRTDRGISDSDGNHILRLAQGQPGK